VRKNATWRRNAVRNRTENETRRAESRYVAHEPVEYLIANYGSRDPPEFLNLVRRKANARELNSGQRMAFETVALARKLHKRGKSEEALGVLQRRLSAVPPTPSAFILLNSAQLYRSLGRHEEAEQAIQKAKAVDPHHVQRLFEWNQRRNGRATLNRKDYAGAAAVFEKLTSRASTVWSDWLDFADASTALRRYDDARKALHEAERIKPNSPLVRRRRSRIPAAAPGPPAEEER